MNKDFFNQRVQEEKIPYDKWLEAGLVRLCKGNTINYSDVTAWFLEIVKEHGITPKTIIKKITNTLEISKKADNTKDIKAKDIPEEIEKLQALMKVASANLDFERCIEIRDTIAQLKRKMRAK